jgi:hypothetical protein
VEGMSTLLDPIPSERSVPRPEVCSSIDLARHTYSISLQGKRFIYPLYPASKERGEAFFFGYMIAKR